jgi:hypothetical protein
MRILSVILVGVVLAGTPAAAATRAESPVVAQARWLAEVSNRLPVSDVEAREHLSTRLFDRIGGAAGLGELLGGPLRLASVRTQPLRADTNAFALFDGSGGQRHAVLVADGSGLLDYLLLTSVPTSWTEVDRRLRALAPRASILAAEVDRHGRCRPRHGLDANRPRPMGSAFKLYVLGAVAHAVRTGTASWDEPLAVRDEWKADPGGVVGGLPAGTVLPLREYASHMIFYSDNSATDHLIHRVGRDAVQGQLWRFSMRAPAANVPFLSAREMFQLKSVDYPTHADSYLALDRPGRLAYLTDVVAGLPAPTPGWMVPRNIDDIEWFASPADLCRAFAGLRAQRQAPVGAALSQQGTIELGLAEARWPVGWFKGGSEPGVLSRSYLATTADGRTFVVSMMISDPAASVNDAAHVAELLALGTGAFQLME